MGQFNLGNRVNIVNPAANVDYKYGPYSSITEANSAIIEDIREIGLTVGINEGSGITEYWWKSGVTDDDLEIKLTGGQKLWYSGTGINSLQTISATSIGDYAVAEGYKTTASGESSHAEGKITGQLSENIISFNAYQELDNWTYEPLDIYNEDLSAIVITINEITFFPNKMSITFNQNLSLLNSLGYSNPTIIDIIWGEVFGAVFILRPNLFSEGMSINDIESGYVFIEPNSTIANGIGSHAEGGSTITNGNYSHSEGNQTTANGDNSHAEGHYTTASGDNSHAEGYNTTANGDNSHAEGHYTKATGDNSHVGGRGSRASGEYTFSHGKTSYAVGSRSVAFGEAYADSYHQICFGRFNKGLYAQSPTIWVETDPLFVIGNGTSNVDRNDAFKIYKNGNTIIDGELSATTFYSGNTNLEDIFSKTNYYLTGSSMNGNDLILDLNNGDEITQTIFPEENVIYVDANNGDDLTGEIGSKNTSFKSIKAAKDYATGFTNPLIYVNKGEYHDEYNLMYNGAYYFEGGANVYSIYTGWTEQLSLFYTGPKKYGETEDVYDVNCKVYGYGNFTMIRTSDDDWAGALIRMDDTGSTLNISANDLITVQGPTIEVYNGDCTVRCNDVGSIDLTGISNNIIAVRYAGGVFNLNANRIYINGTALHTYTLATYIYSEIEHNLVINAKELINECSGGGNDGVILFKQTTLTHDGYSPTSSVNISTNLLRSSYGTGLYCLDTVSGHYTFNFDEIRTKSRGVYFYNRNNTTYSNIDQDKLQIHLNGNITSTNSHGIVIYNNQEHAEYHINGYITSKQTGHGVNILRNNNGNIFLNGTYRTEDTGTTYNAIYTNSAYKEPTLKDVYLYSNGDVIGSNGDVSIDILNNAYINNDVYSGITLNGSYRYNNISNIDRLNIKDINDPLTKILTTKDSGDTITSFIQSDGYISGSSIDADTVYSAGTELSLLFPTSTSFDSHINDSTIHYPLSSITLSNIGSSAHTHPISEINDLQTNLDNKFDKSGGTINGNVTITNDLTVLGTATTINTESLYVEDNIITLNSTATGNTEPFLIDSGIEIFRNSATTSMILWREINSQWEAGLSGSTSKIILASDGLSDLSNTAHTHSTIEINGLSDNFVNISGDTMTGDLYIPNLTANTLTSTSLTGYSGNTIVESTSGGTLVSTTKYNIEAFLTFGTTTANLLEDTNNWDINGVYTGTTITDTYQGQQHYDSSYYFIAVDDNKFIRLIRG